jgi:signal peptidase II
VTPKLRIFMWLPVLVVALDQLTKWWVVRNVELGIGRVPVIEGFFWITHVLNTGIVFGWLRGGSVIGFLILTLVAIALVVSFYRQLPADDVWSASALALILGGAIGNGLDRLLRGAVVDFLRFDLGFIMYPDFNVADSGIVVGVAILLLAPQTWRQVHQQSQEGEAELGGDGRRAAQQDPG